MSEKNSDVVRAMASMEEVAFPYHSFGPLVMRPRNPGELRVFTYNEFGEPEYVPERARAAASPASAIPAPALQLTQSAPLAPPATATDPLYDRLPVMQPPAMRSIPASPLSQPQRAAVRPQPVAAPATAMAAAAPAQMAPPVAQPAPIAAAAPAMQPPPPAMMPEPAYAAPPPPPFFPLLAAALPNATEPSYTPSYPGAPMQPVAAQAPANMAPRNAPPVNNLAAASVDASADRRSLADMFTLLGARAAAPSGAFPAPFAGPLPGGGTAQAASQSDGQALFRRI